MQEIFKETICGLLISISTILFGCIMLREKPNFKNPRLYIGGAYLTITCVIFNYITIGEIKSVFNFFSISFLLYYLFRITIYKAMFVSFVLSIIFIFVEVSCIFMLKNVLQMDNLYIYDVFAGSILSNIVVCTIFIVLSLLIKKMLQKLFAYKMSSNVKISIFAVLSGICVLVFFYIGFSNLEIENELLISVFCMAVFLIILFSLVKQKIENNKITEKYDSLIEFMKSYEEIIDEQRIQHHENKNQLINIKCKLIDKDKKKNIIEYIDSILDEKLQFDKEKYSKLKYLPSNGFKGIIYYKIMKAEELGIKVSVNVSEDVEKSILHHMGADDYKQLCRIIGVYLDNAIEASCVSLDKVIGIEVYYIDKNVKIVISNSYIGEINIKNINENGYSTKGNNRGYGLPLVKYILDNSNIFVSETTVCNGIYTQKLMIKGK